MPLRLFGLRKKSKAPPADTPATSTAPAAPEAEPVEFEETAETPVAVPRKTVNARSKKGASKKTAPKRKAKATPKKAPAKKTGKKAAKKR